MLYGSDKYSKFYTLDEMAARLDRIYEHVRLKDKQKVSEDFRNKQQKCLFFAKVNVFCYVKKSVFNTLYIEINLKKKPF